MNTFARYADILLRIFLFLFCSKPCTEHEYLQIPPFNLIIAKSLMAFCVVFDMRTDGKLINYKFCLQLLLFKKRGNAAKSFSLIFSLKFRDAYLNNIRQFR